MNKLTKILSNLFKRLRGNKQTDHQRHVHRNGNVHGKTGPVVTELDLSDPDTDEQLKKLIIPPLQEEETIPRPETFLGENHDMDISWVHPDDLFVDFQVINMMAMDDPDFFFRYVGVDQGHGPMSLTPEEREEFPQHFYPCFADMAEVVKTHMRQHLQYLNGSQAAWMVAFGNLMGLIIVTDDDEVDIKRRSIGFEDETKSLHYQMQFMRFDPKAIARFGPSWNAITMYHHSQNHYPPLQVNFAKYKEEE